MTRIEIIIVQLIIADVIIMIFEFGLLAHCHLENGVIRLFLNSSPMSLEFKYS